MSVRLKLIELYPNDAYNIDPRVLQVGDVIEFDSMPNFKTWDAEESLPTAFNDINGFDHCSESSKTMGTNLRTGTRKTWCFHAVKFDRV